MARDMGGDRGEACAGEDTKLKLRKGARYARHHEFLDAEILSTTNAYYVHEGRTRNDVAYFLGAVVVYQRSEKSFFFVVIILFPNSDN